jgi:hypothetical protein
MKRPALRFVVAYAIASSALFVLETVHPAGWPLSSIPPRLRDFLGFVGMLAPLILGFRETVGVVRRLERDNRARPAWVLLSGWLGAFAAGEAVLGSYRFIAFMTPPTPSLGDALFLVGYASLIVGSAWFVRVYATSGLPLGSAIRPWLVAGATGAAGAVVGSFVLDPTAHSHQPMLEAAVAIAYPVLDFVVLVPAALLLAITAQFRGGRVWVVWAYILSGFVVLSVADVLFAYFDLNGMTSLEPLMTSTFIAGYTLTAVGVAEQRRMME